MQIEDSVKLDYSDVLIRPKRSTLGSRKDVDLHKTYKFKHADVEYHGVPIMTANMDTVGTFEVHKLMSQYRMFTCMHKHYSPEQWKKAMFSSNVAISSGILKDDITKLYSILEANSDIEYICLDVANGYSEVFSDMVRRVRNEWEDKVIIAGNVVTADMTQELILAGADVVKVGIGPGSVCTTRVKTGVGYPQLSAVIECADAAHGLGGHIIADGGCTCPGDVAKAFGAGADFVMLGGMLAGHDETGTEFYGMSSDTAMGKYSGGVAEYRASEGKTVSVPSRGPLANTLRDILGGLRSACTYVGARNLKDLPKCTTFVRVNNQVNQTFGNEK
jgi:GMP reductase